MTKQETLKVYTQKLGWKVVPVKENSKMPIGTDWNLDTTWTVEKVLATLANRPNINFGLLLGDIVDVEADSEKANHRLDRIIGDYPHPIYQSTKSKHHLFQSPDPELTRIVVDNIEFRGRLHHSVLPPSKVNGVQYKWLKACPIPPMPESLRKFFLKSDKKKFVGSKPVRTWEEMVPKSMVMAHKKRG